MNGVRVRHELRRRLVRVASVEDLTPRMRRVVVEGDALAGFTSLGPDDHVKLFFPEPGDAAEEEAVFSRPRRDYTPIRFDADASRLSFEFVLHGHGPAARWAARARAGDPLGVGGIGILPYGWDMLIVVGVSLGFYLWGVRSGLARPVVAVEG